jgi:hypothetical protein
MDKDEFTGVKTPVWWLLEPSLDSDVLNEKRKDLGQCWGWDPTTWFAEPDKMVIVFDFLQLHRQDLLRELDVQVDDVYVRSKWLDDLITAKTAPAEKEAGQTASAGTGQTPPSPAAAARPGPTTAAKRPSAFARAKTAEETPAEPGGDAAAATKTDGTTSAAEPATRSPFGRRAASTGEADQASVGEPATASTEPTTETAASEPGTRSPGDLPTPEQAKDTLAKLAADPAVNFSQEDMEEFLTHPNFAQELADAEAELEAKLAAFESSR